MNKIFTKLTVALLFATGSINLVSAQTALKVGGVNPFKIESSAALEVESTNRGFLPPRVASETVSFPKTSTASVPAVPGPENGLLVYSTDSNSLLVNVGEPGAPKWFSIVAASPKSTIRTITSSLLSDKKVGVTDNTIICDTSGGNFALILPDPTKSEGRILVISKIDDTPNSSLSFTVDVSPVPASYKGLKIGENDADTLNYPKKPFRIQSDGTNWVVIDNL